MSKKKRKRKKAIESCEHRCDRRTADFVARQIDDVQETLCDLIVDMRTFEHYSEIEDTGWCLRIMQRLKRKYRAFADEGAWPESS